jgi:hypothetical protein
MAKITTIGKDLAKNVFALCVATIELAQQAPHGLL